MRNSRRSRIIDLLSRGKSDEEILRVLDAEFPAGTFETSNKQALNGTKRDLRIPVSERISTKSFPRPCHKLRDIALNREELIGELHTFHFTPVIEKYRFSVLLGKTTKDLLSFSFGNNIYRAFHHESPSLRYARWRWYSRAEVLYGMLMKIKDQEAFDTFLHKTASSLVDDWGATNNYGNPSKMNTGIALKIVNLVFKHFFFSQPKNNRGLRRLLHVPWDSKTLEPLRNIWTGTPIMPISPSQGFVKDLDTYAQLHVLITAITQEAKVDRIIYELWAWDNTH